MLLRLRFLRLTAVAAALATCALTLTAQDKPAEPAASPLNAYNADFFHGRAQQPVRYFNLHNRTQQGDENEILVALRNALDPSVKVYLVASTSTIVIAAPESQLDLAAQIIHELDVPRHSYRLEYTVTTLDDGKSTGTQHFTQIMVAGQRATLKQGSKIPVATGSYKPEASASETQFTYLDVGINLDSTLDTHGNGASLLYKIEQSSVAPEPVVIASISEPVIRQSVIQGVALLTPNKPVILGGIDIPGSTRHLDVAVSLEPLP